MHRKNNRRLPEQALHSLANVQLYLVRIEALYGQGPALHSILEMNSDAQ